MQIDDLGLVDYLQTWEKMQAFTLSRDKDTPDALWLLEHPSVYTQGQAGKAEHIFNPQNIPIVQSDRGGQVTYHGPGQLVAYVLMDIVRKDIGIKTLVHQLEEVLIQTLKHYQIAAKRECGAPGVYVEGKKIASIGLRVKQGRTYHGIALNVDMDLSPFQGINPCGFQNLQMTQITDFYPDISVQDVKKTFGEIFLNHFESQTSCQTSANICNP